MIAQELVLELQCVPDKEFVRATTDKAAFTIKIYTLIITIVIVLRTMVAFFVRFDTMVARAPAIVQ
jgi:hypothetical protein